MQKTENSEETCERIRLVDDRKAQNSIPLHGSGILINTYNIFSTFLRKWLDKLWNP